MKVEVHYSHFEAEAPDDEWIPKCVEKGWVIITGDKGIETDPINAKAIEESGAKLFITADTNSKAEEWAAAIIVARRKMARIVEYNNGTFCVDIDKHASNHVSSERYKGSGGPKPKEENVIPQPPEEVSGSAVAEPEKTPSGQELIQFPDSQPTVEPDDEDDIMSDIEARRQNHS
jgi:hypothetical protein